jgi:AraC-like DNA-binding protein
MHDGGRPAALPYEQEGLPSLRYALDGSGEARFWHWREAVSTLWDIAVEDSMAITQFRAHSTVWHLRHGILVNSEASSHSLRRTPATIARVGVDHVVIQMRLRGRLQATTPTGSLTMEPGDIGFIDMMQTFMARSTDYSAITLFLPREMLGAFGQNAARLHGAVLPGDTSLGRLLGRHLMTLCDAAPDLTPIEAVAAVIGTAALAQACAGPLLARSQVVPEDAEPGVLQAIRRLIESDPGSADMTAEQITARFGLSRSVLYRLFKPLGGVAEYVRQRRLAHAYRQLTRVRHQSKGLRVADVARDCGFESDAVFSRAFRRVYGLCPRDARAAAMHHRAGIRGGEPAQALRDWIINLTPP